MAEIAELVDREIIKRRRHINVPKAILKPVAHYLNKFIWWPTISPDEVEMEFMDQKIDPKAKTFKDLDIEPDELENLTFYYLVGLPLNLRAEALSANLDIAILPKLVLLRSASCDGTGETGREEVSTCYR